MFCREALKSEVLGGQRTRCRGAGAVDRSHRCDVIVMNTVEPGKNKIETVVRVAVETREREGTVRYPRDIILIIYYMLISQVID